MLLTPTQARGLIEYCIAERFAVLAVNVDSSAAICDCITAAKEMDAPIILETSLWQLNGVSFGAGDTVRGLALYCAHINLMANSHEFLDVPVIYHTDHIKGPNIKEILTDAVRGLPFTVDGTTVLLSPSSISIDASELSNVENISLICSLIETSKECGRPVTLEMEAGLDRGYTHPEEVEVLVMGVEKIHPGYLALFAPGLGNRHGYSADGYPDFRPENVGENARLLERLTGRKIGVVLHGSSGLADEQIKQAVASGLTKMNWSTMGTIIRSSAASEYYETHREQMRPDRPDFKKYAMDNGVGRYISARYVPVIKKLITLLGSAGKASGFMKYLEKE